MRLFISIVFTLFLLVNVTLAQPGLPDGPTQVPIDGGLGWLALAGGSYAWYKLRAKNKLSEEE
jgi:hypothetical protein